MTTSLGARARRTPVHLAVAVMAAIALAAPAAAVTGPSTVRTSIDAGSGAAELPAMTPDGSREVMVGRGSGNTGVWLVDRTGGQTYHVTTGMDFNPAISADGNVIAYVRYGTNRSVYVIDVTDPANPSSPELVSKAGNGQSGNGLSDFPSLDATGRDVAFQSTASNLTPDTPLPSSGGPNKVYVHDRVAGTTEMVSVDNTAAAQPGNGVKPSISADGTKVAFASEADLSGPAPGLAPAAGPGGSGGTGGNGGGDEETTSFQQVWLRDRTAETTTSVSVDDAGVVGDGGSALVYGPSISSDGTSVAFESDATNLVPADTNGRTDAFVRDLEAGTTTRASERTPFDQVGAFHPITPARLVDTRLSGVMVAPGESYDLTVTGGDVPSDAKAVALNVTTTDSTGPSFFTVYPTGSPLPTASTLNFAAGEVTANSVMAQVGTDGKVSIYNSTSASHLVVDVTGWYDDQPLTSGGGLISMQPSRLLDTRLTAAPLAPGASLDLQVAGVGQVPSDATAVALNLTATDSTGPSYLTAYPTGEAVPGTSTVNVPTGEVRANSAVVKVGTDGKVSIYNSTSQLDLVVDLTGWVDAGLAEGGFTSIEPVRALDTRTSGVPIGPGQVVDVPVLGIGAVPAMNVMTVALNLTATDVTGPSYLTVYPTGTAMPATSNLNVDAGDTRANEALVQVGADGKVSISNSSATANLVVDLTGWYSGTQVSEGGSGPAISADGGHVAFESLSSTLTAGDVNGVLDAFVRDLGAPLTERVSVVDETTGGTEATGTRTDGHTGETVAQKNGADVAISADGNLVAFTSNGNLSNDRAPGEENPEELSTESAVFTRTRS